MANKLIFFGTDEFSAPALRSLISRGYELAAVVTKPDARRGRGRDQIEPVVKQIANQHGIDARQPAGLSSLAESLRDDKAKLGVLVSYGKILPQSVIDSFQLGIVNLHPSALPKYRGPSPIEQTILNGDSTTAVTLMKLSQAMDAGPIYASQTMDVPPGITRPELNKRLSLAGAEFLVEKLPDILAGKLRPKAQDDTQASYTKLLTKADGDIDWSQPASQIARQIRAFLGWPGSYSQVDGVKITILEAEVGSQSGKPGEHFMSPDGSLGIYAGQDSLIINRLQPAGRQPMSGADFIRGYQR